MPDMGDTVEYIDTVQNSDGDRFDVWSPDGTLDTALHVSPFCESNVKPVSDEDTEAFIRDQLEGEV
jgi:hypothetical protein